MKIEAVSDELAAIEACALAVPVYELAGSERPDEALDALTGGMLRDLYSCGETKGKPFETTLVHRPQGLKAGRLLLVGAGPKRKFNLALQRRIAGAAVRTLQNKGVSHLAIAPGEGLDLGQAARAIAEGAVAGAYETDAYKTAERQEGKVERVSIAASGQQKAAEQGRIVGEAQNLARRLGNEPGNVMTPSRLAAEASGMAVEAGLEIEVLGRERMEELGMGALLGVARGSAEPPAFIVLRYRPNEAKSDIRLGLIGKAVTFDTGGISIKPSADMDRMKYDMAGGAAAIGAMRAIAALKPAVAVTALIPAAENMPGSRAMRPGDVLTTLSGKTVEVLNTDAEGRLLLCDAIAYAQRLGCNRLVDAATLTGSIVVALGYERTGLFSNDEAWRQSVEAAAEAAGEKVWPMPLDDEYLEQLKSGIADLANVGSRWGGAVTAAKFLEQFAKPVPWAHLDIAGTAWLEQGKPDMPKGPTGVGVRTFVALAEGQGG